MRSFLLIWFGTVSFLSVWFGLSVNDLNFGMFFFSREMYDTVFGIYGKVLGMAPESIPPLIFKAVVVDSLFVLGLVALRYRKKWWPTFSAAWRSEPQQGAQGTLAR